MTKKEREPWLTIRQAAAYVGLNEFTLRSRMNEIPGAGRTRGKTGDWRVKASDLDRWMQGQRDDR